MKGPLLGNSRAEQAFLVKDLEMKRWGWAQKPMTSVPLSDTEWRSLHGNGGWDWRDVTTSQGSPGKLTATRAGRDKEGISLRASGGTAVLLWFWLQTSCLYKCEWSHVCYFKETKAGTKACISLILQLMHRGPQKLGTCWRSYSYRGRTIARREAVWHRTHMPEPRGTFFSW